MRLTKRQRHELILTELYASKHVKASGLARQLNISEATVRRDLRALSKQGQIELSYGEATLPQNSDFSFRSKAMRNKEAKRIVARLAAELVGDGQQVFIDSGTTSFELVGWLKMKKGLSIITGSARLVLEFDTQNFDVILLGGHYRPDRMDTIGSLTNAMLDQLRGYKAFIGADGLSMDFGLTAADIESAHIHRLAVKNATEAILLVDHTKFIAPSLCKIVGWDEISTVVTDVRPNDQWMEFFEQRNIKVVYPIDEGQESDNSVIE